MYSIENFLANNSKYKIYEAKDDYFINENQLKWLKKTGSNKITLLQNGSHLGFLYRKEFQESFKNDIFISDSDILRTVKK
jgi:hypothetical protein